MAATTAYAQGEDSQCKFPQNFSTEQPFRLAKVSKLKHLWMRAFQEDAKIGNFAQAQDLMLVLEERGTDVCVIDFSKYLNPLGWVATSSLVPVKVPTEPANSAWIGYWNLKAGFGATTASVKITQTKRGLLADGESVWRSPAGDGGDNMGGFDGVLKLHGNEADLVDDDEPALCKAHMTLLGRQLVMIADEGCYGAHAEMSGVYRR